MKESSVARYVAIGAPVIAALLAILFLISFLITDLSGLPYSVDLPFPIRIAGVAILVAGLAICAWMFHYRGPASVIVSTYVTLAKLFRRIPLEQPSVRTEPLVVEGPQKYTRNPLYFGVVVMVLGWAILTSYTFVFIATLVLYAWYRLFLIPFEERELLVLFGDQYRAYAEKTPAMIPFTKRAAVRHD